MILKSVLFTLFSFCSLVTPKHSPNPISQPPIILILDGSGSMWGKIGHDTKIAIARDVVHNVLDKMDPSQAVGLVAYGHRQKSDCGDIETLIEPGINNHDAIKTALNNINPTGKTPLANTALKVIEQLKKDQQSASLILISDGEESCNGDLCEVVRKAKEAGVEFVLHIVGFDLGDADQLALECAAKAGDGIYLNAENGEQLNDALSKTTALPVQSLETSLTVKVMKDGTLHDAIVKILKSGEVDLIDSRRTYAREKTNPAQFGLEPGTYDIHASLQGNNVSPIIRKDIIVTKEEIKEVIIDFSAGRLSILTTGNGKLWDSVVNIPKTGESQSVAKGRTYKSESTNPMIKELSPGFYDVKVTAMKLIGENTTKVFKGVEVEAGKTSKINHNFEYGEILVSAQNNGVHWDCVLNLNGGEDGKKYLAGGRTGKGPNGKHTSYLVTPGNYNVLFKPHHLYGGNPNQTINNINVEAGSIQNAIQNYETGMAQITVTSMGELWDSTISIYQDEKVVFSKRSSTTARTNPLEVNLTPGIYKVDVKALKLEVEKRQFEIVIKQGEIQERIIKF